MKSRVHLKEERENIFYRRKGRAHLKKDLISHIGSHN